jgi:tRNA(fMet)-specific endonuclease VapC
MYLLDTNLCTGVLNGTPKAIQWLQSKTPQELALSSITVAELLFGARNSVRVEENLLTFRRFIVPYPIFSFDHLAAEEYGIIRANLKRQGTPIGDNDMLIASIALANDLILVTHNVREFARVPGLRYMDWNA